LEKQARQPGNGVFGGGHLGNLPHPLRQAASQDSALFQREPLFQVLSNADGLRRGNINPCRATEPAAGTTPPLLPQRGSLGTAVKKCHCRMAEIADAISGRAIAEDILRGGTLDADTLTQQVAQEGIVVYCRKPGVHVALKSLRIGHPLFPFCNILDVADTFQLYPDRSHLGAKSR